MERDGPASLPPGQPLLRIAAKTRKTGREPRGLHSGLRTARLLFQGGAGNRPRQAGVPWRAGWPGGPFPREAWAELGLGDWSVCGRPQLIDSWLPAGRKPLQLLPAVPRAGPRGVRGQGLSPFPLPLAEGESPSLSLNSRGEQAISRPLLTRAQWGPLLPGGERLRPLG